jgi:hypothetical protein
LAYSCKTCERGEGGAQDTLVVSTLRATRQGAHGTRATYEVAVDGLDRVANAVLCPDLLAEQLGLVDLLDVLRRRLERRRQVVLVELADARADAEDLDPIRPEVLVADWQRKQQLSGSDGGRRGRGTYRRA